MLTALEDLTGGTGPDSCIDAVGLEAHSTDLQGDYDKVKTALMLETDRPGVLRQAIQAVRKGGTLLFPASTAACWTKCRLARLSAKASP